MQSEFSLRINGKTYEVVETSRDMTLGDFLEKNAVSFSNDIERKGAEGVILFLCDHNCFAEPCHYFLDPFRTDLLILADRDLVAVDFLCQECSEHEGAESSDKEVGDSIGLEAFLAHLISDVRHGSHSFSKILSALLDCRQQNFPGKENLLSSKPFFNNELISGVYVTKHNEFLYFPITITEAIKLKHLKTKASYFQGERFKSDSLEESSKAFISLERIPELREIESFDEFWKIGSSVPIRAFAQRFINDLPKVNEFLINDTDLHFLNRFSIRDWLFDNDCKNNIIEFLILLSAKLVFEDIDGERVVELDENSLSSGTITESGHELMTAVLIPKSISNCSEGFYGCSSDRSKIILQVEDQIKEIIFDK